MRVENKGLIDRTHRVSFSFDGQQVSGYAGDTVASALLANDIRLMGRSFKYHRPRGVLTAGSEEPNALMTIGSGAQQDPNVRATVQEIYSGLQVRSQNAWPSLGFDALAVNNLLSPFFGAGFYYKMMMWPKPLWEKFYEPLIRRAAGLGGLSEMHNPDNYERAWAYCDVLVIGSGPTGLMAAMTAAKSGADVILCEEDSLMGGRLNAETHEVDGMPGQEWAAKTVAELKAMDNVRLMTRTTVTGAYDQGTYGALERVNHHGPSDNGKPLETFWRIVAKASVLAAGALERPIAFRNNDRPGVMTASAVRSYLNRWGVAAGKNVAVFGNNDNAHRTAMDLQSAGVNVVAMIDSRSDASAQGDYRLIAGGQVTDAMGAKGLSGITVTSDKGSESLSVDCLAVSGGWNPSVHMTCHMNGRPAWRDDIAAFVPKPDMVPGMIAAGAANGDFSTASCLQAGITAANEALGNIGKKPAEVDAPKAEDDAYNITPLSTVPHKGRAWLDFQNDVTVKDIKGAAQENFRSVEHMKRFTTQGMATDQGKNSNVAALAILADATGRAIPETGTTTFRPPYTPVSIAAMGAGAQGDGFAPQRFTTSHQHSVDDLNAPMIEAGLWYRPSYFPKAGEKTWRESCDREVGYVRNAVGVADVSTLGKIDIQGKDAGEFLDFVYTNMFSTLPVGKVRYGLMLREDGHVMDDGTTARWGENHYVMTTTTAAAGEVMKHLEFVKQALRRDLDVNLISTTEQWAQFAVAGPKSRDLLNDLLDQDVTDETFPFMGCGAISIGDVKGRLFRISFSGEHAYEVAVPSRYGDSLFRALVTKAEAMGGGAYGMEALNVLRIEKGFITHAEIHGRITADDIGMGKMVSAKKDCVGKTSSQRPGLHGDHREQLVGLKPVNASDQLTAGAHLFNKGAEAVRVNDQGYVTSVCWSPTMNTGLGLGFLTNGRNRHGEVIRLVDHLRGLDIECEVCHPVFLDPEGGRARG